MNRVVHFEINAKDMDAMQKFYEEVFGWEIKDMGAEMGGYRMLMTGKDTPGTKWPGISGGMTPRKGETPKGSEPVNAYVCIMDVNNLDATLEKIKSSGGSVSQDKMPVPGVGQLAYCKDPEGNLFGVLQPE
jgi:predicted enzyme related to lactoylglutathione lyase